VPVAKRLADVEEAVGERSVAGSKIRGDAGDEVGPNNGNKKEEEEDGARAGE
jgi:hypothetical protein